MGGIVCNNRDMISGCPSLGAVDYTQVLGAAPPTPSPPIPPQVRSAPVALCCPEFCSQPGAFLSPGPWPGAGAPGAHPVAAVGWPSLLCTLWVPGGAVVVRAGPFLQLQASLRPHSPLSCSRALCWPTLILPISPSLPDSPSHPYLS